MSVEEEFILAGEAEVPDFLGELEGLDVLKLQLDVVFDVFQLLNLFNLHLLVCRVLI